VSYFSCWLLIRVMIEGSSLWITSSDHSDGLMFIMFCSRASEKKKKKEKKKKRKRGKERKNTQKRYRS
jgi:hypothetical protein